MFTAITADELRSKYLRFFQERGHAVIPSASLIPEGDASVLFTTAGMHPLVPYLQGRPHPAGKRLADVQKCVRTGDIDEVGDPTHLTFFEMLGNWSLGDYFKAESIRWSWEFLTSPQWLGIPADRITVSVFAGDENAPRDDEAAGIWRSVGVPAERIVYLPAGDNWWAAGDEGPCGPDTEIFFDTQPHLGTPEPDSLPGGPKKGRFVEIWNNVFMAYNRASGKTTQLPSQNVDTGMGLERTLAVLTGAPTVYETSAFQPVVRAILAHAAHSPEAVAADPALTRASRVLADHLRAAVFILGDERGVTPSNVGAGYVLRRLIRRAIRFCSPLGIDPENWVQAGQSVIDAFGDAYPELRKHADRVRGELEQERERFQKTLTKGTQMLEKEIARMKAAGTAVLPGDFAFTMYDTYGFPIEFTQELAGEAGLTVDLDGFRAADEKHRAVSNSGERAKSGLADDSAESVRYHTATHLLHAALRKVLGTHVQQKGSNITRERLRFDFSHPKKMTKDEIAAVEKLVQEAIDADLPVTSAVMPYTAAKESGAIGLFEDRYGNDVSVYTIGEVSREVCAGPHVGRTGEIGKFKIQKEEASSAGVRRIKAVVE
jgi:alanyl-tRNA synthetase